MLHLNKHESTLLFTGKWIIMIASLWHYKHRIIMEGKDKFSLVLFYLMERLSVKMYV